MLNEFVLTKDSICPKQFVRILKVQNKTSEFFFNKCVLFVLFCLCKCQGFHFLRSVPTESTWANFKTLLSAGWSVLKVFKKTCLKTYSGSYHESLAEENDKLPKRVICLWQ